MKRRSILFRINVILGLIILVMLSFSVVVIYVGEQVNRSSSKVINYDMPAALNTLAMLSELGKMNANLLEYVTGEREERQEYYRNFDKLFRFKELIPEDSTQKKTIEQVTGIILAHREAAEKGVFLVYDPSLEKKSAEQINDLIENVGKPLETLLEQMKNEEISDAGSGSNFVEIVNDDLPAVRYYLELVDQAGDMLAALDRFILGQLDAKRAFYNDALQFESYLSLIKPLEQNPDEIIRLNEIERLFNELKSRGALVFDIYSARSKVKAMQAIDELEHQSFSQAEQILAALSSNARQNVNASMNDLGLLAKNLSWVLGLSTAVIIILTVSILFYLGRTVILPIAHITIAIDKLRKGERDFKMKEFSRNDELTEVLDSLKQFQTELCELDALRYSERQMKDALLSEKNTAEHALEQLKETQSQLIATEKMASLGALVAGVAHEINTPLGISVTMSTTLNRNHRRFLDKVKSGELKRSSLEHFEKESEESFKLLALSLGQASNLINNFKQVATDQTSSKRRVFNVLETLNEIMSTLHHCIKRTHIQFFVEGPDDIEMNSYPGPLGQVITNLFNNAMLHAFEGRDTGEVHIRFAVVSEQLQILFSDNGIGVKEEFIGKLFDPFYTTKLGRGGSGLGLNIVHNIVHNIMGGKIRVESEIGTTFEIRLPLTAPAKKDDIYE
ncbi:ATP-binding protein [Psychromonas aquimarina]|uniref:ATP-binding protein n=1 Tax=Psychromonas aquimarina TaxID=444919 RepID=UPI000422A591|nr:ATP-binding protein [Psychromonas aquimarina]